MARHRLTVPSVLIVLMASSGVASAQPASAPSGHWEGSIQTPGQELKIEIDLVGSGDTWKGTINVPVQGLKGFPLSGVAVQNDDVTFAMKGVPGDPLFKGTVSKDAKTLSGTFLQGGGSVPFSLTRTGQAKFEPLPKSTAVTKDLEGSWQGTLDADGTLLRLTVKLSNQPDGTAAGTIISVDQNGVEIPIAAVVQTNSHLTLHVPSVVGRYEGDFKDGELTGKWTQGPKTWPLVFKRSK
jgi:uncharacterized protein